MKTVWKFNLHVDDRCIIKMPRGAEVLSARSQYDRPDEIQIWARVDPNEKPVRRKILIVGTGHPRDDIDSVPFIDTILTMGGSLVWHVFDGGEV